MARVGLEDIREAAKRIGDAVHRTPLVGSRTLDAAAGAEVRLKLESLQKTGSFKPRGATNRVRLLGEEDRRRGIVTVSAGNHAQAAAYACARLRIPCHVVMPASAPRVKVEAVRGYGATIVLHEEMRTLFQRCEEVRASTGATFLHPFDDPAVIAGHGTVGLEIVEDDPEVDTVVCGIGGGGLISGIATAVKAMRPEVRVLGVEPVGAPAMTFALERGEPVRLASIDTIADGLAAPFAGALNLEIVREHVDAVVLVTDREIVRAMRFLLERAKLVVEPAGAAAVAALLAGKIERRGGRIAAVVSGGNLDLDRLPGWLAAHPARDGDRTGDPGAPASV